MDDQWQPRPAALQQQKTAAMRLQDVSPAVSFLTADILAPILRAAV